MLRKYVSTPIGFNCSLAANQQNFYIWKGREKKVNIATEKPESNLYSHKKKCREAIRLSKKLKKHGTTTQPPSKKK